MTVSADVVQIRAIAIDAEPARRAACALGSQIEADAALNDVIDALRRHGYYVDVYARRFYRDPDAVMEVPELTAAREVIEQTSPGTSADFVREATRPPGRRHARLALVWLFVTFVDDAPAACCLLSPSLIADDLLELTWMAVRPDMRRRGLGSATFAAAVATAAALRKTIVLASSTTAFYEKFGATRVQTYAAPHALFTVTPASAEAAASR